MAIDGSEDNQINIFIIHGLDHYQIPKSVDFSDTEGDNLDSDVDCSDSSEASDSNSTVSVRDEIMDELYTLYIRPYFVPAETPRPCLRLQSYSLVSTVFMQDVIFCHRAVLLIVQADPTAS